MLWSGKFTSYMSTDFHHLFYSEARSSIYIKNRIYLWMKLSVNLLTSSTGRYSQTPQTFKLLRGEMQRAFKGLESSNGDSCGQKLPGTFFFVERVWQKFLRVLGVKTNEFSRFPCQLLDISEFSCSLIGSF